MLRRLRNLISSSCPEVFLRTTLSASSNICTSAIIDLYTPHALSGGSPRRVGMYAESGPCSRSAAPGCLAPTASSRSISTARASSRRISPILFPVSLVVVVSARALSYLSAAPICMPLYACRVLPRSCLARRRRPSRRGSPARCLPACRRGEAAP